jgi:hypothetical protein
MIEKLKKYFNNYKELTNNINLDENLKILKLGINIGKSAKNNEEEPFLKELDKEIVDSTKHPQNLYDFKKEIESIVIPIINEDIKNKPIILEHNLYNKFDRNFFDKTQKLLGVKISNVDYTSDRITILLFSNNDKGFLNSIFDNPLFEISIENESGDEWMTWDKETNYGFSCPILHPIHTNIIQLENYKKKFKEVMDGRWGKKYLIDILSRNN